MIAAILLLSLALIDDAGIALELEPGVLSADLLAGSPEGPRPLVVARAEGLEVVRFADGEVTARLDVGKHRVFGWCVAGAAGHERVYVLRDGGEVVRWDGASSDAEVLMADPAASLPSGVTSLPFVRDLDGDGRVDVVVPTARGLDLWLAKETGLELMAKVSHKVDVGLTADGPGADEPGLSQSIRIPRFDVKDMNADGVLDLAFEDEGHVQYFWSDASGALPERPTFTLDLEEIRASLPVREEGAIDTSNLLSMLESTVRHLTRDFDRDGYADLLLRRGRKVTVYRGGSAGVDRSRAAQVLKTGGNLLSATAFDDDGDGRDDLALLLIDDLSLGQVLLWLVKGGELSLDLFVYRQTGPLQFSRKPTRRRTLVIDLPNAMSLVSQVEDRVEGLADAFTRLPVVGDFDADGAVDDVARLLEDGTAGVFRNAAPEGSVEWSKTRAWRSVVMRFDRVADGGDRVEDDILDLLAWAPIPGRELIEAIEGRSPDVIHDTQPRDEETTSTLLFALDVDGAPGDELVIVNGGGADDPVHLVVLKGS